MNSFVLVAFLQLIISAWAFKSLRNNIILSTRSLSQTPSSSLLQSTASSSFTSSPISLTGDGGVVKTLIGKGQGKDIEVGDILAIKYQAFVKGQSKPFAKSDKETCIVKDGSFIKGWDISISSMKIGEKATFTLSGKYAYGSKGVESVIPPDAEIVVDLNILAWLGNQLQPESLFQKDLDIDPFVASTPEQIQEEFDQMQARKVDKYAGSIFDIYWNRIKSISFGFNGVGFFTSQSGEKAPWYLNPNITFPSMITFVLVAFLTVFYSGGVKEKGTRSIDPDLASITRPSDHSSNHNIFLG